MPPANQLAQKEALLLWIMITSSSDYNPMRLRSAAAIVTKIAQDLSVTKPGWNWPNLSPALATGIAAQAFSAQSPVPQEFEDVMNGFQLGLGTAQGTIGWPPSANPSHPKVAEVATFLGVI